MVSVCALTVTVNSLSHSAVEPVLRSSNVGEGRGLLARSVVAAGGVDGWRTREVQLWCMPLWRRLAKLFRKIEG